VRKRRDRFALAVGVTALALLAVLPQAAPAAGSERTRLTIEALPEGVFGAVDSPSRACAEGRRVAVFAQRGERRRPRADRRVATAKAKREGGVHRWYVRTRRGGELYARLSAKDGCRGDVTRSISLDDEPGGPGGGVGASATPCGPYVSETSSRICRLDQIYATIERVCRFGNSSAADSCTGEALRGSFPWGQTGTQQFQRISFRFNHRTHELEYSTGRTFTLGYSYLRGTIPSPASAAFHIDEALAVNDQGETSGDRFYTPDLPGQNPGEPGGPLYLNYRGFSNDAGEVYIHGYLYLR
jgi:hypothetical protein